MTSNRHAALRKYNKSPKGKAAKQKHRDKSATVVYMREYNLQRNYGITERVYQAILKRQGGVCALCGSSPKKKRLHVDHCHVTDRIRGLLCASCNGALGALGDDVESLTSVIHYLEGKST